MPARDCLCRADLSSIGKPDSMTTFREEFIRKYLPYLLLSCTLGFGFGCNGNPDIAKQRYLASGQHYFDKGEYDEATIQFRKAVQLDPRFGEAYFRLAMSYIKLQRWHEAYPALLQATELEPDRAEAHLHLGQIYLQNRDYETARKECATVLEHQPTNAAAYQLKRAALIS